jgi:transcriptional regulator
MFANQSLNRTMGGRSSDLVQGTLDMLILKSLTHGSMHGYAIMNHIQRVSRDVISIEEGSLYPALHRIEKKGWIRSEWGKSENNRRAKFYALTPAGRTQLEEELSLWARLSKATERVLEMNSGAF